MGNIFDITAVRAKSSRIIRQWQFGYCETLQHASRIAIATKGEPLPFRFVRAVSQEVQRWCPDGASFSIEQYQSALRDELQER